MRAMHKSKLVVIAAWVAIILAVSGALMLFPIGTTALNAIFVIVKICMVTGLLVIIFSSKLPAGFTLWTCASVVAVVMTACKWALAPAVGPASIFLYIGSMVVDLGMPALVYALSKRAR